MGLNFRLHIHTPHSMQAHEKRGWEWEKQLSNPSSSGNLSANMLFRSGSLARPIKTLTLHNTHIRMEASVEFSPICGELFCVVQCVYSNISRIAVQALRFRSPINIKQKSVHICCGTKGREIRKKEEFQRGAQKNKFQRRQNNSI